MSDADAADAEPDATAPVTTDNADPGDGDDGDDDELVPIAKVRELRREVAGYRKKYQGLERAFGEFDDQDIEFIQNWMPLYLSDPVEWAKAADEISTNIKKAMGQMDEMTPEQQGAVAEKVADAQKAEAEGGPAVTKEMIAEIVAETLDAKLTERDQARQQNEQVEAIFAQIKDAGYDDPDDRRQILDFAVNKFGGDIDAAVEHYKTRQQAIIDAYLEGKTKAPTPPPTGGGAAPADNDIGSVKDATKLAEAYVRSMS